jgi:membrane complex biogenesis BtpA family protein
MWTRDDFRHHLTSPVIGMIHLRALPGSPDWDGDLAAVEAAALRDLDALVAGGLRAAVVENFHDAPFFPDLVPPETVAAMAVVAAALRRRHPLVALGVNVLRNDAAASLAVAGAVGGAFIRVNVHTGAAVTDQGLLGGRAHQTVRRRRELGLPDLGIFADLRVKHAAPLAPREVTAEAADLRERGRADALIVSGAATGAAADPGQLASLRDAMPDCPLVVGSGVTADNVEFYAGAADGAIVGTSLKVDGAVSAERTARLFAAWQAAAAARGMAP